MKRFLAALVITLGMGGAAMAEHQRLITTTGRGTVEAVPDMATVDIGVSHQARLAGEALALTSAAMTEVLTRLEATGIEPRDMQTQGLSLQPLWSRQNNDAGEQPRITGYVARNGLMVRVRDLGKLGQILDEAVSDGANTFNGVQFSLQDTETAMAAARAAAVKDAMTRAQDLATAAGVTLGPVQTISEAGGAPRPVMMEMAPARMASDVPIAAGEVSLSVHVSMEFAILD